MTPALQEKSTCCPYCGEPITLLVDASVPEQHYVEDCFVCCRPIEVSVVVSDDECFLDVRTDQE